MIISVHKDQAIMLNGVRKETIKGKGTLNNQISSLIFMKSNEAGVTTHFVRQLSEAEQLSKKVDTVPFEIVLCNVTTGSFSEHSDVEEGIKLDTPIVEFCYKNDDLDDPFINDEHVKFLGIASDEDITCTRAEARRINDPLKDQFDQIGLNLTNFKLEFGKNGDGKIIPTDESLPSNCRLWDAEGRYMDRDVFRRDLGSLTDVYEAVLEKLEGFNQKL